MNAAASLEWRDTNQAALVRAFARIKRLLDTHIGRSAAQQKAGAGEHEAGAAEMSPGTTIGMLARVFGLSAFETDLVTLCAGVEMDASLAATCGLVEGAVEQHPTFSLALAVLPGAHWSAVDSGGPLRHWHLVELGDGNSMVTRPLRLDERVLHFLAGIDHLDERLACLAWPVPRPSHLHRSHAALATAVCDSWSHADARPPAMTLSGADAGTRLCVAAEASARAGLELWAMPAELIPANPPELTMLARLWEREAWLDGRALVVECDVSSASDPAWTNAQRLADRMGGPIFLSGRDLPFLERRQSRAFDVVPAPPSEQRDGWRAAAGALTVDEDLIDRLAAQFSFGAGEISELVAGVDSSDAADDLWRACVTRARPRLSDLAQRISPQASWDDLVLPQAEQALLHQIASHGRHRALVQEEWGFAAAGRGLGVTALFEGESGTGKTMAAEVIARDLGLDLYRVDLSQVVSKYIGETEKNLRRVFDAAETGGAVLLFDEADAIFGRRSEVRDSHDRYANVEVGYLLQRMEAYRGIAVLTTNVSSALDPAFLRRLRFIVSFPFPDEEMRERIWQRIFPAQAPVESLEMRVLARMPVAGGSIRNIALQAAFLAAADRSPATMSHVLAAARTEFQKLGRNFTGASGVERA